MRYGPWCWVLVVASGPIWTLVGPIVELACVKTLAIQAAIQVQFKAIRGRFRQFVSREDAKMRAWRQFAPRKVCLHKTKREVLAARRRHKGMRESPPF